MTFPELCPAVYHQQTVFHTPRTAIHITQVQILNLISTLFQSEISALKESVMRFNIESCHTHNLFLFIIL